MSPAAPVVIAALILAWIGSFLALWQLFRSHDADVPAPGPPARRLRRDRVVTFQDRSRWRPDDF
jgi:hypothetical protein